MLAKQLLIAGCWEGPGKEVGFEDSRTFSAGNTICLGLQLDSYPSTYSWKCIKSSDCHITLLGHRLQALSGGEIHGKGHALLVSRKVIGSPHDSASPPVTHTHT